MNIELVFSKKRLDSFIEKRKEKKKYSVEYAKLSLAILNELQKQTEIKSVEDENMRMEAVKEFIASVQSMTFSEFIRAFPRNDGGTYHNIEELYRTLQIGVNDVLGENAKEIIGIMNVNVAINNFKENVRQFRNDRKALFFADGSINTHVSKEYEGGSFDD